MEEVVPEKIQVQTDELTMSKSTVGELGLRQTLTSDSLHYVGFSSRRTRMSNT